jgi:hypothetical protein
MAMCVTLSARAAEDDVRTRVLVASLSGYSKSVRDSAQADLTSQGESAEARLAVAAATATDEDARRRAQIVLDDIRLRRRLRELMEPTRVTLHFDHAPARDVLAKLYVRAGSQWRTVPPEPFESAGDVPVTVHLDDVPFWYAVARVEELTSLILTDDGGGEAARFVKVPLPLTKRPRTSVHGPFRVVAEDGPIAGSIRGLKVYPEPKIQVAWHSRQAKLTDVGGANAPLGLAWLGNQQADARVAVSRPDVFDVELPLGGLFGARRTQGTIIAVLVAREEVIEDLLPAFGTTAIAGQEVSWSMEFRPRGAYGLSLQPRLRSLEIPAAALAAKIKWSKELSLVRPTLYDGQGLALLRHPNVNVMAPSGFQWTFQQRPAADRATTNPDRDRKPIRLTLSMPTESREIEIPFDFAPAVK